MILQYRIRRYTQPFKGLFVTLNTELIYMYTIGYMLLETTDTNHSGQTQEESMNMSLRPAWVESGSNEVLNVQKGVQLTEISLLCKKKGIYVWTSLTLKVLNHHTIIRAAFVCLSVCLFVPLLLRGPLTDLRQTCWVCVGGPRNCPWGVLFWKG